MPYKNEATREEKKAGAKLLKHDEKQYNEKIAMGESFE